jgi:hypothetical protein
VTKGPILLTEGDLLIHLVDAVVNRTDSKAQLVNRSDSKAQLNADVQAFNAVRPAYEKALADRAQTEETCRGAGLHAEPVRRSPVRAGPEPTSTRAAATTWDAANTYTDRTFPVVADPYVNHRSQLSIEQDQPSIGYFYADQFNFLNSGGNNGYIGLQTHMFTDHDIGKGVVFSIWGATTFDTSGCAAAGCVGVSGVEGTPFLSIRLPFAWVAGVTYEVRMIRGHTGNVLNQRVDATIKDVTHNVTYSAGALNVPTDWGGFNGQTYQWVEEYLPNSYPSCSNILRTAADLGWGHDDGDGYQFVAHADAQHPAHPVRSGDLHQLELATAYLGQGSYRHIVGALSPVQCPPNVRSSHGRRQRCLQPDPPVDHDLDGDHRQPGRRRRWRRSRGVPRLGQPVDDHVDRPDPSAVPPQVGAATVTGQSPALLSPAMQASKAVSGTTASGITATIEGTDSTVWDEEGFNEVNGWLYLPVPEERIMTVNRILAMKFPTAPTSAGFITGIGWLEYAG